jgi:hypothetical protein
LYVFKTTNASNGGYARIEEKCGVAKATEGKEKYINDTLLNNLSFLLFKTNSEILDSL